MLTELLSSVEVPTEESVAGVNVVIASNAWCEQFRKFLLARGLNTDLATLQFLLLSRPLSPRPATNNNNKKEKTAGPAERQRLFRALWVAFLSEDSDCLVPLSDNTLWAELRNTEAELAAGRSVSTAALDRMGEVGRDPGLWEGGLEPSYARFLAQTPPPFLTACLLSIL